MDLGESRHSPNITSLNHKRVERVIQQWKKNATNQWFKQVTFVLVETALCPPPPCSLKFFSVPAPNFLPSPSAPSRFERIRSNLGPLPAPQRLPSLPPPSLRLPFAPGHHGRDLHEFPTSKACLPQPWTGPLLLVYRALPRAFSFKHTMNFWVANHTHLSNFSKDHRVYPMRTKGDRRRTE